MQNVLKYDFDQKKQFFSDPVLVFLPSGLSEVSRVLNILKDGITRKFGGKFQLTYPPLKPGPRVACHDFHLLFNKCFLNMMEGMIS